MLYRLIILNGMQKGRQWNVPEGPFYIGSDPSCDLCLVDAEAAARHAMVEPDGDALRIRDLGSMHGLLVNQQETREARLRHGDICEIGRTRLMVEARVRAEVESTPTPRRRHRIAAIAALLALAALAGLSALGPIRPRPPAEPPVEASAEVARTDLVVTESREEPVSLPATEPSLVHAPAVVPDEAPATDDVEAAELGQASATAVVPPVAATRPPSEPPAEVPAPTEPEDTDVVIRRKLLGDARAALEAREFEQAQRLLNSLLALSPEQEDALALQAELWEHCGMIKRAIRVWAKLADQGPSPLRERAERERRRLVDLDRQLAASTPPIRLVEVRQVRLPGKDEEEEIRVVSVHLERDAAVVTPLDPDAILVQTTFYERLMPGDQIVPVAQFAPKTLRIDGPWPAQGPLILSTVYRSEAATGTAPRGRFYGYHVRLLAYDQPVAEFAQPRELLLSSRAHAAMTPQDAPP